MTNRLPAQEKVHGLMINADLSRGPFYIDGMDTTPKLFRKRCQEYGSRTAHQEKKLGIWQSHSWDDFFTRAKHIGLGLVSLGLKPGDVVSILSEDNKEWIYTDMAVQSLGAICSGIYTTDSAAQLEYLINDSDSRFLLVENDEQLDKFLQVREQMPGLIKVIVIDRDGLHGFSDPQIMFLDQLYELGAAYDAANPHAFDDSIDATKPEDTAILVYTSGTTGKPKGAMISHGNLIYSVSAGLRDASAFKTDDQLCFLPLCHMLERLSRSIFQSPWSPRSTLPKAPKRFSTTCKRSARKSLSLCRAFGRKSIHKSPFASMTRQAYKSGPTPKP